MNYLAHTYLSGTDSDILVGNFIADAVKGRQVDNYSEKIQQGIHLHREIDTYTDSHEVTKRSKSRLYEKYRHYSAVIIDIFYDHYLAVEWNNYHQQNLESSKVEYTSLVNDSKFC